MYSRSSSRRSLIPPPDYSGVLFNSTESESEKKEQTSGELQAPAKDSAAMPPVEVTESQTAENTVPQPAEGDAPTPAESAAPRLERTAPRRDRQPDNGITLPLPAPHLSGLDECLPRYPLPRRPFGQYYNRKRKRYSLVESTHSAEKQAESAAKNALTGLLSNAGFDDLMLAALILMIIEGGNADPITVLLLGILLI